MGRTSGARERLIAAMASLAHRRGYVAVGVDDVCKAAGVKKGSFYHFFPSKHDLMLAALDRHRQNGDAFMRAAFDPAAPPLKRIERLLEMLAEFETANKRREGHVLGCPFGNVAAEVGGSEPALTDCAAGMFRDMAAVIADALREAKRLGQLDKSTDENSAADAIVAYFEGLALLAKARNDPALIRRLGPRAVRLAHSPTPHVASPHRGRRR